MSYLNLSKIAVVRPIATAMIILLFIILGLISQSKMRIDLFPDLKVPVVIVSTKFDGVSPKEIEEQVTKPLEKILATVPNIDSVTSQSQQGQSTITLNFKWGSNIETCVANVRDRIDFSKQFMPENIPSPTILQFDPTELPIVQLAIENKVHNSEKIKDIIEKEVLSSLQKIKGVASANIEGVHETQYVLELDSKKLEKYNLTYDAIKFILLSKSIDAPAGNISEGNTNIPLSINSSFKSKQQLLNTPIPSKTGIITLSDLSLIKEKKITKNYLSYLNGKESVGISIFKQNNTNPVKISSEIEETIDKLNNTLPYNLKINKVYDESIYINQSIKTVYFSMLTGGLLAGIVLFLFLKDIKITLIVFLTIPLSVIISFIGMYVFDQYINIITLGGIALGIGMMVDNAIVIIENIYSKILRGSEIKEASISGSVEVQGPMIASTITSIIVFLPLAFIDGLSAQLFRPLAIVVALAQFTSLIISFTLIPLFSGKIFKGNKLSTKNGKFTRVIKFYTLSLEWALKKRNIVYLGTVITLLVSISLIPFLKTEFFPHQDQSFVIIRSKIPNGLSLEKMDSTSREIVKTLEKTDEITNIYSTVGGVTSVSMLEQVLQNEANFYVILKEKKYRNRSDTQIAEEIRKRLSEIPNLIADVTPSDPGFFDDELKLRLTSPSPSILNKSGNEIFELLNDNPNLRNANNSNAKKQSVIKVNLNDKKASLYGLTSPIVAKQLADYTKGTVVTKIKDENKNIPVLMKFNQNYNRLTEEYIYEVPIYTPLNKYVPLQEFAKLERSDENSTLSRNNLEKDLIIKAEIYNSTVGEIKKELNNKVENIEQKYKGRLKIEWLGQISQMKEAFSQLTFVLGLAVIFVFLILAAQFESLIVPFVILFSIPVISIGVIIGHLVFNIPLGVGSIIGVLMLIGVVINNTIVLVDTILEALKKLNNLEQAIKNGAPKRLRPIVMTAVTTILGILPLILGVGEGVEMQRPMAVVILFGLMSSTFISLYLIPCLLYSLRNKISSGIK
ncbi:MAG: acriflavin resistance protein [Bacillales bacterium]|nr:acriflavin resistance protein [Bacillales bacterium]